MSWFWGNSNQQQDPTKKLDPELQDYLKKEAPTAYTTKVNPTKKEISTYPIETSNSQSQSPNNTIEEPAVPAASLYPDGRYAHLWKTYKPLAEIEATQNTDSAHRVIENFKQRKESVHEAAMENCALEHEALTNCFNKSNWLDMVKARATMCADDNRKFSRCYTTQAALGYAGSFDIDEEREERIQMHADKLYHQMLDYEERVAEARKAGQEPPPITSLFNPDAKPVSPNDDNAVPGGEQLPEGYTPSTPLDKLSPHQRELEIRSINAELEQKKKYVEEAAPYVNALEESHSKRRERAKSWFGETISKWIT